ncbi:tubulin-tyrosine ligase [Diplogelasinospora grovesii]|uniref:Tubulin-tyrosine ligase n=1 Tax=Diplogelasinospora grovesii TaxID=303347 RepID=A0AAN6NI49_9PEZI|nr:tubulin-tyrosine ligase [Diplogelasinospora grovesii]
MHILIVNDDGPPSPHSSPYVHSLVRALQSAGHVVSVCLPHTQRSWIGKAHMVGQTVKPIYYRPPPATSGAAGLAPPAGGEGQEGERYSHGTTHARPSTTPGTEEWILVDGTPASCVQIGLYHYFQDRGPIDLVVSGPNYGRNTTAVFALSSGTLGGALEAAVCKRRAIALSYAFFTRNHDRDIIAAASRQSVRVIEALWKAWPGDGSVDLYSVNVPLLENLEHGKALYANMLQNYWGPGSCFTEIEGSTDGEEEEERIREEGETAAAAAAGGNGESEGGNGKGGCHQHKHFKWSPRFTDVYKSVDDAPPGNDGWAVQHGHTSVTPLKANFWHPNTEMEGKELQLTSTFGIETPSRSATFGVNSASLTPTPEEKDSSQHLYALIDYQDDYAQPLILSALKSLLPADSYTLISPPAATITTTTSSTETGTSLSELLPAGGAKGKKVLQIAQYESIDFEHASLHPDSCLINSYIIRKALIRKHFLSATVENWVAKNPGSILATNVKRSEAFEVDYAEFLDDALVEAFDLRASLERNEQIINSEGVVEWWILKPSMSDRGQGIRLFSTLEQLQGVFDGWEIDSDDEGGGGAKEDEAVMMTSHLRHFVAQPYIHPPLLIPELGNRKFHIRTYVLAVGGLRVYVYRHMLALFAGKEYKEPGMGGKGDEGDEMADLEAHLTNTCLQDNDGETVEGAVHRFWDLPLPQEEGGQKGVEGVSKEGIWEQICEVTGELFEAAARGMVVHFQPLDHAFEVFGLDFLVDDKGTAWLLEANAFPDFKQTGAELNDVVGGFWEGVLRHAVLPFATRGERGEEKGGDGDEEMVLVREVQLAGRR